MGIAGEPGATTATKPSGREIVVTCSFAAPRRLVFEAWTSPQHLPHWMLGPDGWTMTVCDVDLRPGGAFRYVWRRPDGDEMEVRGVHREIVRPDRLVASECWGGGWPETLNTFLLTEDAGRTTVAITIAYPSQEARDAAFQTGMTDGMARGFERLDAYLRTLQ